MGNSKGSPCAPLQKLEWFDGSISSLGIQTRRTLSPFLNQEALFVTESRSCSCRRPSRYRALLLNFIGISHTKWEATDGTISRRATRAPHTLTHKF